MSSRPIRAALFLPNERERTKSARPTPRLSFTTRPDANTGVFHSTKGLRQGPGPAKQCAKPRSAKLRLASRLPQTGTMGSGVHFCEYSACKAVCIRIGSVNQRLQAHIYCVLEQTSRSDGTQARASRAQRQESIASGSACCKIASVPTAPRCRKLRFLHGADGGRHGQTRTEPLFYAKWRLFYAY